MIILNNCRLHKSDETLKFVDLKGIKLLSIPAYTPQLNTAEKMIALIKSRIRKFWSQNKPLNLALVKSIVDKIDSDSCEG